MKVVRRYLTRDLQMNTQNFDVAVSVIAVQSPVENQINTLRDKAAELFNGRVSKVATHELPQCTHYGFLALLFPEHTIRLQEFTNFLASGSFICRASMVPHHTDEDKILIEAIYNKLMEVN